VAKGVSLLWLKRQWRKKKKAINKVAMVVVQGHWRWKASRGEEE